MARTASHAGLSRGFLHASRRFQTRAVALFTIALTSGTYWQHTCGRASSRRSFPTDAKIVLDSVYFETVARGVQLSLSNIGITSILVDAFNVHDPTLYILLTVSEYSKCGKNCTMPLNYIVYNFEQLTTSKKWPSFLFDEILTKAVAVWDYSLTNVHFLDSRGIRAIHVPYGASAIIPSMSRHSQVQSAVFFAGENNSRRYRWLKQFETGYESIFIGPFWNQSSSLPSNCFERCLLPLLGKTRVALNVHFYEGSCTLEVVRLVPLVYNQVWVVSERSSDAFYDYSFRDIIDFVDDPAQMKSEVDRILKIPIDEYLTVVRRRKNLLLSRHSLQRELQRAVDLYGETNDSQQRQAYYLC